VLAELASSVRQALVVIGTVYPTLTIATAMALCLATFFLVRGIAFSRFPGRRNVLCPETGRFATIRIRALRAAATSLLDDPRLRVSDCSQWPERQGCAQRCISPPG
jgi:hypothetical protein